MFLCSSVQQGFRRRVERALRSFEEHVERRECSQLEEEKVARGFGPSLSMSSHTAEFLNMPTELEYLIVG